MRSDRQRSKKFIQQINELKDPTYELLLISKEVITMANVEKVSIALTAEMAAVVRDAVNSGEYASNSEVVREALRDWRIKRSLRQQGLDELGQLWDKGLVSGPGKLGDIESIKAEARRRHRAAQTDTK